MPKKPAKTKDPKDSLYVTRSESFAGIVKKSSIGRGNILEPKSKMWYQHQINKFKPGESVTIEIHTRKPKRTEQQNRYYWGVYLPMIAAETGEKNLYRLHELFKGKFLTEAIVEVLGEKVRIKKSTTDLGVGAFCQYIMDIEADTGVIAPPTENYDLAPLQRDIENDNCTFDEEALDD